MEKKEISLSRDDVLILTKCFYDQGQLNYQEHLELYRTLADYIFPGKRIWVKRSREDFTDYSQVVADGQVADRKTSLSRLPNLLNGKGGMCLSFAGKNQERDLSCLKDCFEKMMLLDEIFLQSYRKAARYAAAIACLQRVYGSIPKVKLAGIDDKFFKLAAAGKMGLGNMGAEQVMELADISGDDACLIDAEFFQTDREDMADLLKRQDGEGLIILLSSEGLDLLYRRETKEISERLMPVPITRLQAEKQEKKEECVYIISRNQEVRKAVSRLEMNMENKNLRETVEIQHMDAKDIRIKALEGILEATENRLLYYIEKCNLLKSEKITELVEATVNNYIGMQRGKEKKIS